LNTKAIALTIAFAAVTVVLNPRFSGIAIPSFVPTLWFQVWEIAVVAAFFLLGVKSAGAVAVLNTIVLLAVAPGTPFNEPLANLVAILSTLAGVYVAYKLLDLRKSQETPISRRKMVLYSTALGIISRLAIMLPYLYIAASLLGISAIIALLPLLAIYDLIVALYTVPLGYLIASAVNRYVKLNSKIQSVPELSVFPQYKNR
jgi:hypothetical protein